MARKTSTMKYLVTLLAMSLCYVFGCKTTPVSIPNKRPNILIAISDDQSWAHASAYGASFVKTPALDRVAREGIRFNNAIAPSPGCAPSRGAFMLGRYPWQNERAGNHQSIWPERYKTLPMYLQQSGYFTGYTGKGVGPFFWALGGGETNPAGEEYNEATLKPPYKYINNNDYAENFKCFLAERPKDQPFYFWYGATEPHRWFERGSGAAEGKKQSEAQVPPFLPDAPEVRTDMLDYAQEIEWFDSHLGRMIQTLEAMGELDNTIIIVTSDNGMAFPAAKANCWEYGIHVPLVLRWGEKVKPGRAVDDLVSFVDILPTLFDIADVGLPTEHPVSGRSLTNILYSKRSGLIDASHKAVFSARERHSCSRYYNLSYPMRAMRTQDHLLIWNCRPERWPSGAPTQIVDDAEVDAYTDIDWTPEHTLSMLYMMAQRDNPEVSPFLDHAVAKRPEFELYDIHRDPGCMQNLVDKAEMQTIKESLIEDLMAYLKKTDDPRLDPTRQHSFESHRRYAHMREFPAPDWTKTMAAADVADIKAWTDRDTEPVVKPRDIGDWGVQTDRWRLVHAGTSWKLYDIQKDPQLEKDLSSIKIKTLRQMRMYHRYWLERR